MPNLPNGKRPSWRGKKEERPKGWARDPDARYNSTQWRRFSALFRKLNPICATPGCGKLSQVTDHIIPVRDGGDFYGGPFQALCHSCHNRKTMADNRRRRDENEG